MIQIYNEEQHIKEVLEKGKEYEFLVISDADENGKFTLSRKKVDLFYAWQELKKLKEANEIIKGEVVQVVRGGLLVDIIGVRGFVPSSQIQNRTIEYKVGDKIEVKQVDSAMNMNAGMDSGIRGTTITVIKIAQKGEIWLITNKFQA